MINLSNHKERFPHYFAPTDAMLGFYRKFKGVSLKVEMYLPVFNLRFLLQERLISNSHYFQQQKVFRAVS